MSDSFGVPANENGPEISLYEASEALIKMGGHFHHFLGQALRKADGSNARKITRAFESDIRNCHDIWKRRDRNDYG
jgi:hypothetical protein